MAGGGSKNPISSAPGNTGGYTWNGAKPATTFDSKAFTTGILGDLANFQKSPLQTNPYSDFTDYSTQTKGLINQGLSQASDTASNPFLKGMASGSQIGNGNPFVNQALADSRQNTLADIGAQAGSAGRFGGSPWATWAGDAISKNENTARLGQYNQDVQNMYGAQGALNNATATGLGYSNLLDQKSREQNQSNQKMWDLQYNAPYQRITQTLGALQGQQQNANQPWNWWDVLGTGLNVAGFVLPFL